MFRNARDRSYEVRFPSYFISLTVAAYLGWFLATRPRRNAMWYKVEFKLGLYRWKILRHFPILRAASGAG